MKTIFKSLPAIIISVIAVVGITYAASNLTAPTGTPSAQSYTLSDIYNKLADFSASPSAGDHYLSTTTAPAGTFHTLTEIYTQLTDEDADLVTANIADGVSIFGVTGSLTGGSTAAPLKTGQTKCYATDGISTAEVACTGTNQDGESKRGVATSTVDNADGTISDSSTGLMWVKDPSEIPGGTWGTSGSPLTMTFADAITNCEALDYASHTDWHLPNIRELQTLVDFGRASPAIDVIKFPNTQSDYYWSATTYEYPDGQVTAWFVYFDDGITSNNTKANSLYVRCVREI